MPNELLLLFLVQTVAVMRKVSPVNELLVGASAVASMVTPLLTCPKFCPLFSLLKRLLTLTPPVFPVSLGALSVSRSAFCCP